MAGSIVVRKYPNEAAFGVDASRMADAGWQIAAQGTGSGLSGAGAGLVALGSLVAILGYLLVGFPGLLAGVVLVVIGAFGRRQTYTVTYRYDAATDRRQPVA